MSTLTNVAIAAFLPAITFALLYLFYWLGRLDGRMDWLRAMQRVDPSVKCSLEYARRLLKLSNEFNLPRWLKRRVSQPTPSTPHGEEGE